MKDALIKALVMDILIPEVVGLFTKARETGQSAPTEAEVRAIFEARYEAFVAQGVAFLQSKGVPL